MAKVCGKGDPSWSSDKDECGLVTEEDNVTDNSGGNMLDGVGETGRSVVVDVE